MTVKICLFARNMIKFYSEAAVVRHRHVFRSLYDECQ